MTETLIKPTGKMWWMLILTMLVNLTPPMLWMTFSSVSDTLQTMYGVSGAQWSLITTMHGLGCGVGLFIVGAISQKMGFKQCCLIGLIIMLIAHLWFFLWSPTYISALLAELLGGFGNAWIYNAGYSLAMVWFEGTTAQGIATGATTATDGLGAFAGMFLFGFTASMMTLRSAAILFAVVVVIIILIAVFFLKNKSEEEVAASHVSEAVEQAKYTKVFNRNVLTHSMVACGVIGGVGFAANWGPTMLIELGMAESTAGLLSSMYTVLGVFSGIIFGGIADKAGRRKPTLIVGGAGMVAGYLLIMLDTIASITIGFMLCGFFAYVAFSVGFALITDTVKDTIIGKANGILQGSSYIIGMIIWPMIVGLAYDITGSYIWGLGIDCLLTVCTNIIVPIICAKDQYKLLEEKGLSA